MKLLYCYIQFFDKNGEQASYHGMDKIELSLSATDNYSYKEKVLKRVGRKAPLASDFWTAESQGDECHNIYNINIVAGENGSGKTTTIRCLLALLDYYYVIMSNSVRKVFDDSHRYNLFSVENCRALLLLEENGVHYLINHLPTCTNGFEPIKTEGYAEESPIVISYRGGELISIEPTAEQNEIADLLLKTKAIYMTNTLNQFDFERNRPIDKENEILRRDFFIYDVSLGANLCSDPSQFFVYEVYKQVKYVFDRKQTEKRRNIPEFRMPRSLRIRLRLDQYRQDFSNLYYPLISFAINKRKRRGNQIPPSSLDLTTLLGILCISALTDNLGLRRENGNLPVQIYYPTKEPIDDNALLTELKHWALELDQFYENKKKDKRHSQIYPIPPRFTKQSQQPKHPLVQNCIKFLEFIFENKETLLTHFIRVDENTFELFLNNEDNTINSAMIDFMQKYRYTCEPVYTIDFDWGLSSGEENMLRILSNLYYVFDRDYSARKDKYLRIYNNEAHLKERKKKTACNTVLLFMDEADLTLHPEWQRRLIAILTSFIPQIYPSYCVKDVQLILTTHSPLILGDIPNENITYLFTKEAQQDSEPVNQKLLVPGQTFGQNIHTILKDNFFLGNGTVGDFAARKINAAAKRLTGIKAHPARSDAGIKRQENELETFRKFIDLVAPGVLQTKLYILYQEAKAAVELNKKLLSDMDDRNNWPAGKVLKMLRELPPQDLDYVIKTINQENLRK